MRIQWYVIVFFGLTVFINGCSRDSFNPTAPTTNGAMRTSAETPSTPSDDTNGAEIQTIPYRSYVIAAIGDSITYGQGASSRHYSYPNILEDNLRATGYTVAVYNQGIPGAATDDIENDFQRMITGINVALIMIGSNDVLQASYCFSPENCHAADNIRSMINTAIRMDVVPVLATVTPKDPAGVYAFLNPRVKYLNTQLFNLAQTYNIAIVDTYAAVLNNGGEQLYYDKHHFNDSGYRVIADAWYQVLVNSVLYPLP